MEKVKVVVLRPWLDGQKAGDVITLSKVHPSLKTHVRLVNEPVMEKTPAGEQGKKPEDEKPNPEGETPKVEGETLKADSKKVEKSDKK
jgi:hypothetical protein